ncbi:MAG: hypothetical protein MR416_01100 [Lachnospiraceae bacterium]|nr:hypothetical protein [Lachnospiraceae bacterium]MDD7024456.1 hypothetical protein [Oscillospiraceae bacterium]
MTYLLTAFIGISVNLDNFLIGISLGLKHQHLTLSENLVISAITGLCAGLSTLTVSLLSGHFVTGANLLGGIIMVLSGIYCLLAPDAGCSDLVPSQALTLRQSVFLGFILSMNCIPPAFSAGILKLPASGVGFFCALFSFLTMYSGNQAGLRMTDGKTPSFLGPVSAVLLILIGCMEVMIR